MKRPIHPAVNFPSCMKQSGKQEKQTMQLKKQNRKVLSPVRSKFLKIESFNPVMKAGIELLCVSTVHNHERATHLTLTTRKAQP